MTNEISLKEHCRRIAAIGGAKKSAKKTEACRANARLPRRKRNNADKLHINKNN